MCRLHKGYKTSIEILKNHARSQRTESQKLDTLRGSAGQCESGIRMIVVGAVCEQPLLMTALKWAQELWMAAIRCDTVG